MVPNTTSTPIKVLCSHDKALSLIQSSRYTPAGLIFISEQLIYKGPKCIRDQYLFWEPQGMIDQYFSWYQFC